MGSAYGNQMRCKPMYNGRCRKLGAGFRKRNNFKGRSARAVDGHAGMSSFQLPGGGFWKGCVKVAGFDRRGVELGAHDHALLFRYFYGSMDGD